jgi:hypothetical protein
MRIERWVLGLGVALVACDGGDEEVDAGMMDAGRVEIDAGRVELDAGREPDAGPVLDYCVPYAANLATTDAGVGLGRVIGDALSLCGRGPCLSCALSPSMCGASGNLETCILDCMEANNFGACSDSNPCDDGFTCDETAMLCRSDLITQVNDALDEGDVDLDCLGCYTGIPACISRGRCGLMCASAGCACDVCQCDNDCAAEFAACSGLPPHLDCEAVATMCE